MEGASTFGHDQGVLHSSRYLVTEVRESRRDGFYRAYGDIRRLR
ncbi:hypothetical protein OG799_21855 [Micromonospora sp. NBC_00898]|nr:hypothetical protein OG799_21855 [Micromonospora sp. NBC_00898]